MLNDGDFGIWKRIFLSRKSVESVAGSPFVVLGVLVVREEQVIFKEQVMATERQVAANRANGLKGGVKTEAGKAISRLNARKHGIFATALTDGDAEELRGIEEKLVADLKPVGIVEEMLVEKVAATYLRMQRCARAEAEHCKEMWAEGVLPFVRSRCEERIAAIGLFDMRLTNQFLKLLHEIEERQEVRKLQEWGKAPCSGVILEEPEDPAPDEEMKNEPNPEIPECRQETKNEPNSSLRPKMDLTEAVHSRREEIAAIGLDSGCPIGPGTGVAGIAPASQVT